ncbi:hypothetical protein JCM18909_3121 [Cutibacterium acnes JCM 18909]|nr:hypothetical protein JCM18909_3121 [Cutibacterium acnes JCM 18909]
MGFWGANLFVLAYIGVLAGGFIVQFGLHEFPCPLCMLQRYSMMLASLGPLYIIVRTRRGSVTMADFLPGLWRIDPLGGPWRSGIGTSHPVAYSTWGPRIWF